MKVAADTNILVRVVIEDDPVQSRRTQDMLAFDRKAIRLLEATGLNAREPA